METLRSAIRRALIGGFVLIVIFFALAIVWLLAVQLNITPHGE